MKHIFYLTGMFFLFVSMTRMYKTSDRVNKSLKVIKEADIIKKAHGVLKWDEMSEASKQYALSTIFNVFLVGWILVGLLSFNWVIFSFMIVFMCGTMPIFKASRKILWLYTSLYFMEYFIISCCILFTILNSYHLKIDLYSLIINLL